MYSSKKKILILIPPCNKIISIYLQKFQNFRFLYEYPFHCTFLIKIEFTKKQDNHPFPLQYLSLSVVYFAIKFISLFIFVLFILAKPIFNTPLPYPNIRYPPPSLRPTFPPPHKMLLTHDLVLFFYPFFLEKRERKIGKYRKRDHIERVIKRI